MTYILNLGQFRANTEVGLNVPRARKFFGREFSGIGGKGKKGAEGPVKQTIRRIIKEIRSGKFKPSYETVINKMRDPDFMADLFEASKNPIPLQILGVYTSTKDSIRDEDEDYGLLNYFEYCLRNGKKKSVTFRRINDALQEILNK